MHGLRRLLRAEQGGTAVEYGLIIAAVACVLAALFVMTHNRAPLGDKVNHTIDPDTVYDAGVLRGGP